MRLADLFRGVGSFEVLGDGSTEISHLSYRSSLVGPGHLFFCVPGFVRDGHDFAPEAVSRGAAALCVERPLDVPAPQVLVPSVRRVMGHVASSLYGRPSAGLATLGITGTNGKTTTAFLCAYLLDASGRRSGLMGTVERRIGGEVHPAERTTPEAIDVQRDLALMVEAGDQSAVMEVSSHALDLDRSLGIEFAAVAFTNLTQDHLDYHGTLEAYFESKSRLFLDPAYAHDGVPAVINVGDPFGRVLAERVDPGRVLAVGVGSREAPAPEHCDLEVREITSDETGATARLILRERALTYVGFGDGVPVVEGEPRRELSLDLNTRLLGRYNLENIAVAFGLCLSVGCDPQAMLAALPSFPGVPGRLERIEEGQPFTVAVDYAHTPDSVERVLDMARAVATGRVIGVLGCGGDRDRAKRPLMGLALESRCDVAVLTSDNPRSEDPAAILDDILTGLEHPGEAVVEVDRRQAIKAALDLAEPGDLVLILGKGHETGQEFADRVVPFDDREVVRSILRARGGGNR